MICTTALTNPALDLVCLPACVLDTQGSIVFANRAWRALTAECPALGEFALEGTGFAAACERSTALEGAPALAAAVRQVLAAPGDHVSLHLMCRDSMGRRWFDARLAPLPQSSAGCLVTCEDITQRRKAERRLRRFRAAERNRRRQATQHALLAHFGQFALENPPLSDLTAQAVEVVRRGLGIELCRLLRTGPDDQTLIHAAGSGWDESWVDAQRFDVVVETENRFDLGTRESIVVSDYGSESRFRASPIQQTHGVRSAVEVLICGASGTYGVVGAYAPVPGRFDDDSANFMQNVSNTLAAFI